MRYLLLIAGLLFAAPTLAADVSTVSGVSDANISTISGVSGASISTINATNYNDGDGATCDSCSGDLAYSNYFEDATSTYDCDQGNPCGCSDNANKALSLGTGASISNTTGTSWPNNTYSLAFGSTYSTSNLTWNKNAGTISFDAYCSTMGGDNTAVLIGNDEHDMIKIKLLGSAYNNVVETIWKYADSSTRYIDSDNNAFTGPKKSITFKWDVSSTHTCNGNASSRACLIVDAAEKADTFAFTALDGTYTTLYLGLNNTGTCYLDNLKVYTSWQ